jgi:hypothetical protein
MSTLVFANDYLITTALGALLCKEGWGGRSVSPTSPPLTKGRDTH